MACEGRGGPKVFVYLHLTVVINLSINGTDGARCFGCCRSCERTRESSRRTFLAGQQLPFRPRGQKQTLEPKKNARFDLCLNQATPLDWKEKHRTRLVKRRRKTRGEREREREKESVERENPKSDDGGGWVDGMDGNGNGCGCGCGLGCGCGCAYY